MRVAVVCYALVLRSAALRDEISRFEPLELEVPDEKMHQEAPMNFLTSGETSTVRNADQPEAFLEVISATNCIDGTLHLRGQNVVNSALVFSKECATLRGDMGAQVTLKEPLIFEGDLRMEGDIRFIAARSFWQPCVSVKGNASMFGNIHFEGCRNKDTKLNAGGGGLMVGKTLTQHAGAIAFHNCSSEDRGGGLYVNESIAQNNGTMVFSNCSSKRNGGGLYVDKSMVQNNGTMEFRSCSTESHGGGLYVEKSMVQNNGTIAFSNCSSRLFNGGGLYVDKSMVQNNGTMEFSSCSSESYGGGLYVGESMQNNGTMAFRNCISREKGGGLYVYRGMQNNGMMAFSNCSAEGGGLYELDGAGGGLFVFGSMQNNGTMEFSNCSSELKGGGIHVSENVTQNGGVMEFSNCRSQGDGGGFHTYEATTQNNGQMKFHTCYSALSGGGFYGSNGLIQNSGEMEFTNCSSTGDGGGFYVDSEMMQNGGNLEFHDCRSQGNGGGLFANVMVQNGTMEFQNCSSQVNGGGLYVSEMMQNGAIEFKKCSSKKNGGGVFSISVLTQNGRMDFSNCSSGQGGGLYSSELQSNGLLRFSHCSATRKGGGLYSSKLQSNGLLRFSHCSATGRGGGLHVSTVTQNNGSLGFSNCNSQWNGGCFYSSSFTQKNGGVGFSNCSSQRSGGGLYVASEYDFQHGTAFFHHCSAKEDGGGLWVSRFQQQAPVSFYNCRAAIGGGLSAIRINGTQPMNFHECRATEAGGALRLQGLEGSAVDRFRAENCSATRASAIQARNLTIKSLVLVDTVNQTVDAVSLKVSTTSFHASEGTKPDLSMEAVDLQIDSDVDCSKLRECRLVVTSSAPKLGGFQCSLGAGVAEHPAFGCLACPEGYTQIENVTNGSCRQCPKGASFCHAAKIQMMHGFMLDERNVSRPLHCPTKAACHGGELPVNEGRPMCQKGYGGEGCASCVRDEGTLPALYLMPDSSVLACTPCAPDTASQLLQWCSFLGQRIVLFAVSAASIFAAGQADRVKNSGVYLNQLMAFAAVSGCVVTAVMQTETAQTMKNAAVESLYGTAVFLSEAGSGQGFYSSHCLLSYLGLESTGVFGVHCLDVVVATSLVLLLSFKDFRVALVAGLNCFLPSILADFAKYAVCYSLEEDQTGGMEDLICKHLPLPFGNLLGFLAVGAGFLTVFAVSLLVWILLSTSVKEDKLHELPHVAFLTNKYGEGRRYFEAERLVRKVLLATAAAFYPSTTFPALQMTGLTVITCASMCLYGIFHPYRQQIWNWSELGLLATAQLLIAMASAVISNEEQWDKTEIGQMSMIVTLGPIVTAVCSVFMVKIAMEVWHERRPADGSSHPE